MKGLFIQDKVDKLTISALNYYGADFKLDVFDQDTNTYIYQDLQMSESAEPFTATNTLISEDRVSGTESIKVDSVLGFNVHDRVNVGGEILRIVSIDNVNSELGLHKGIKSDVTTITVVETTGNLGLYFINLTMSVTGTYLVKAKDSVFGLLRTDAIKVVTQAQAAREFKVMV